MTVTHGLISTYQDGCRCRQCTDKATDERHKHRNRGRRLTQYCPLCDRWFATAGGLAVHERRMHAGSRVAVVDG